MVLSDLLFVLPKICTSGYKRYAPLAKKNKEPLASQDMDCWLPKIGTLAMRIMLQMICTSDHKRFAPLATKDMHLWLKKICTSGTKKI